jgi:glycosyltransferase involved in cell wall biosynthesis
MKLRLLVDAHVFDGAMQGTTTYLRGLYSALVKDERFEITLAARNVENLRRIFPESEFRFVKLKSANKFKRLAFEFPSLIRKGDFDFAHFQYITPPSVACRYINTIHDLLFLDYPRLFPFFYRLIKGLTFRASARRSNVLCTVSQFSRNAIAQHFKINEELITVTPNAVSIPPDIVPDIRSRYSLNNYLLYVSRFEPRKNHVALLKAFVDLGLGEKGFKLVFIGRRKDVETVEYDAAFNALPPEIKSSVLHLENIDEHELAGFYRYAQLFVYPSLAEGFGIPPLEAALNKCKVICSNRTALADFDFFGQYLFDPGSHEVLKEMIGRALADSAYPFDDIARKVREHYSWERSARELGNRLAGSY